MEESLQADGHLYEAGLIHFDEAVKRCQGGMAFAPTKTIQAPNVGKRGVSMLQPVMKHMAARSGEVTAAMQLPGCQKDLHAESAQVHEDGKLRNVAALKTYNAKHHLDDSESTDCANVHAVGCGELPCKGCNRDAIHQLACPSCDAMGAFTIFDTPCSVDDVNFKHPCHTCQGTCMANVEVIQCTKCNGLGCLGSWLKNDMQFKCDCTACKGKGYLAAMICSSQQAGSKRGQNDLGWSLVRELKQLTNASDMEKAAKRFGTSKKDCSMAALTEAVRCSPFPSTQMAIVKSLAANMFGDQCVVIEAST